jgi:hypothetical protein
MGNSWDNNGQKHGNNSTNGVFPYYPRCFMVLEYLPAKLGIFGVNVGKYSIHGASGYYLWEHIL